VQGLRHTREDIAELANVLAWDAVGAQIEPYLVQHAEWQRPCGVALGCRSLNSRGIKMLLQAAVFIPQRKKSVLGISFREIVILGIS
jgi:hypothetical protein